MKLKFSIPKGLKLNIIVWNFNPLDFDFRAYQWPPARRDFPDSFSKFIFSEILRTEIGGKPEFWKGSPQGFS